jgi:hypothetical protein
MPPCLLTRKCDNYAQQRPVQVQDNANARGGRSKTHPIELAADLMYSGKRHPTISDEHCFHT